MTVQRYWPCEDGALATQISNGLGGFPMRILGGSPTFAADTSFGCSNPLPYVNSSTWLGPVRNYSATGATVARFLFNPSSALTGLIAANVMNLDNTGTFGTVVLQAQNTGLPTLNVCYFASGVFTVLNGFQITTSKPVMISAEMTESGGNTTFNLRQMDTSGNITSAVPATIAGTVGRVISVGINKGAGQFVSAQNMGQTVIGHITVQSALTPFSGLSGPVTSWNGEPAGIRFARLCTENGIQARIYGPPAVTAAMGPQSSGSTLDQLLQECETADMGSSPSPGPAWAWATAPSPP